MPKVTVYFGSEVQGEYNLNKDEMRIGRAADCEIVVDNMGVSRHHCSIIRDGDGWAIDDKGSNNGTFVNGKRVDRSRLLNKERIVLGKHSLEYDEFGTAAETAANPSAGNGAGMGGEMTMFVDPAQMKKMQEELKKGGSMMTLAIMQGGREVKIQLIKQETMLGKSPAADVPVKGLFIKPIQAKVVKADSGHRIVNLGGWRSVRVNGSKVRNAMLNPGDIIQVAGVTITYKKQ